MEKNMHKNQRKGRIRSPFVKEVSPSPPPKAWGYLILGGVLEIVWASLLKLQLLGGPLLLIFYVCFYALKNAAKTLPVSTVYAVFAGIGVAGTVIVDMAVFQSNVSFIRLLLVALLLVLLICLTITSEPRRSG